VIKVDLSGLNDDKIYYELDKIHLNKASIEKHLFKVTYEQEPESYGFVNYDLTTSYFVGYRCNLSAFGKGKAECHGRRQVLLGVMINDQGYPFKWDVFPGNTAEVKTLKRNIQACKSRFKLGDKNITIVFDRGIISDANADLVKDAKMKYISALDRSQIPASGIDMDPFKGLSTAKVNEDVTVPSGFRKYDDELYFRDGTVVGDKRFIVGFNPTLFKEDRSNRDETKRPATGCHQSSHHTRTESAEDPEVLPDTGADTHRGRQDAKRQHSEKGSQFQGEGHHENGYCRLRQVAGRCMRFRIEPR
jgi:hypothetical protein